MGLAFLNDAPICAIGTKLAAPLRVSESRYTFGIKGRDVAMDSAIAPIKPSPVIT